ncbi:hypothetical protein ZWY2020_026564 [Hordeum vulgare]|nr:hypothetical protein ZWY2020_026564 [Hordeum vulgare]
MSLPPLKHNCGSSTNYSIRSNGYAILTAADCLSSEDVDGDDLSFFKVLIMVIHKDAMQYRLHTFSSAGEWGWSTSSGRVNHNLCAPLCQQNAVVCGGAARRFVSNKSGLYSFDVSTNTGDVSMAKLLTVKPRDPLSPKAYDEPYLGLDAEGRLTLFSLQLDGNQVDVLTWHGDGRCIPTLLNAKSTVSEEEELRRRLDAGWSTHAWERRAARCSSRTINSASTLSVSRQG